MEKKLDKKPLNLNLRKQVIKAMKMHCLETDTDVSTVTEELYLEFLQEHGVDISALKSKPPKANDETSTAKRFIPQQGVNPNQHDNYSPDTNSKDSALRKKGAARSRV